MEWFLQPYPAIAIVEVIIPGRPIFGVASWNYGILDLCYAQNISLTYGTL